MAVGSWALKRMFLAWGSGTVPTLKGKGLVRDRA